MPYEPYQLCLTWFAKTRLIVPHSICLTSLTRLTEWCLTRLLLIAPYEPHIEPHERASRALQGWLFVPHKVCHLCLTRIVE